MTKLSIAIMAVPSREAHVKAMVDRLALQIRKARATHLDVVGTDVFYDFDRKGPWHCWKGAWSAHVRHGSTHHAVLQDDVRFCADLPSTLCALASARPEEVISGFLPRKSVEMAVAGGVRWVRARRFLWAQLVMMPTHLGDQAVRWIQDMEGTDFAKDWRAHDDVRVAAFLAAQKRPVWVPVPHPIEHVGDEIGGSVMGHNFSPAGRRARAWLGEQTHGASLPWGDLRHVHDR